MFLKCSLKPEAKETETAVGIGRNISYFHKYFVLSIQIQIISHSKYAFCNYEIKKHTLYFDFLLGKLCIILGKFSNSSVSECQGFTITNYDNQKIRQ